METGTGRATCGGGHGSDDAPRARRIETRGGLRVSPQPPRRVGAADRIRTGDVQLGKLAFCH
jgi:hypothetical protein